MGRRVISVPAGRPKKFTDGIVTKIVSVPKETETIWHKADELAMREGVSRSELVNKALAEYLNIHYPGNPQIPLEVCKTAKVLDSYMVERVRARLEVVLQLPNSSKMEQSIYATRLDQAIGLVKKIRSPPKEIADLLEKAITRSRA